MLSVLVRRLSDLSSPDSTDSGSSGGSVDIAIVAALCDMTDVTDADAHDDGRSRAAGRRRRDWAAVAADNIMVMVEDCCSSFVWDVPRGNEEIKERRHSLAKDTWNFSTSRHFVIANKDRQICPPANSNFAKISSPYYRIISFPPFSPHMYLSLPPTIPFTITIDHHQP